MYRDPYRLVLNKEKRDGVEKLNKKIGEEKGKQKIDYYRILKLEEQKSMFGLFPSF